MNEYYEYIFMNMMFFVSSFTGSLNDDNVTSEEAQIVRLPGAGDGKHPAMSSTGPLSRTLTLSQVTSPMELLS